MEEQFKEHPLAVQALEKYTEWLNLWDIPEPITFDEFFRYPGATRILGEVGPDPSHTAYHVIIQADYGDDGGAATLYAYFAYYTGDWEMEALVQVFDTYPTILWAENQWKSKP